MTIRSGKLARICLATAPLFLTACGADSQPSTAPFITYQMEDSAVGTTANALLFDYPEGSEYLFRLSTEDAVTSDVDMDTLLPVQERVEFSFATVGTYTVGLEIFRKNGTPYLTDTQSWAYSTEIPDPPIVSFSEIATNDVNVSLLIAGNRKANTNEIWVEGDLGGKHAAGGIWDTLPDSNIYLVQVTPEDGMKTMTVKLRNIYGNESASVEASILKKSVGPTACRAEMSGHGSASRTIDLQLFATNDGPLYYQVVGDVDFVTEFTVFESGDTVSVRLNEGTGLKHVTVKIRDAASNYCEDIEHVVNLSGDYVGQDIEIAGKPLWTDAATVDLNIRYDHFPSDEPIEMKITGDITDSFKSHWIPYDADVTATLSAGSGEKKIFAQFRNKDLQETFMVVAKVYAKPFIELEDAGAPFKDVIISKITGTTHVTITGCNETYDAVAYQAAYTCEPNAAQVSVLYTFDDGTSVTKSATP